MQEASTFGGDRVAQAILPNSTGTQYGRAQPAGDIPRGTTRILVQPDRGSYAGGGAGGG
jgi:hypothetical protein